MTKDTKNKEELKTIHTNQPMREKAKIPLYCSNRLIGSIKLMEDTSSMSNTYSTEISDRRVVDRDCDESAGWWYYEYLTKRYYAWQITNGDTLSILK